MTVARETCRSPQVVVEIISEDTFDPRLKLVVSMRVTDHNGGTASELGMSVHSVLAEYFHCDYLTWRNT